MNVETHKSSLVGANCVRPQAFKERPYIVNYDMCYILSSCHWDRAKDTSETDVFLPFFIILFFPGKIL